MPWLALSLRVESVFPEQYISVLAAYSLGATCIRLLVFFGLGFYSQYWRYASLNEMGLIVRAVVSSSVVIAILFSTGRLFYPVTFPRSLPLIETLLVLGVIGGSRYGFRMLSRLRQRTFVGKSKRVVIMGASDLGATIATSIQNSPQLGMTLIGFLDDDEQKHNVRLHSVPVLGGRNLIPDLATVYGIDQVIIAMPNVSGKVIRDIVSVAESANVATKIMPGLTGLLDGSINVSMLRDVEITDLLKRPPVETDRAEISALIGGKTVLITGAGGSIGSELCRQIWQCNPDRLILLGHGENSIFDMHNELRGYARQQGMDPDRHVIPVIGDIRFPRRIQQIIRKYRPNIIFHAAAHKHVPMMERNVVEAITNNVMGTRNMLDAAADNGVEHFVMISTDKAVNPTNVMGASKRMAEMMVHKTAERTGRPYVAVRFGNVLGSRGSVIHTFRRQIEAGGPVTVTHPDITRFFMTIPEAVQLTLQASVLGTGGEVFVLDMGQPVKIVDLAKDIITLSGFEVGHDIDVEFVGLRPGEKLYEELFIGDEQYERTRHNKLFLAGNAGDLVPRNIYEMVDRLNEAALDDDEALVYLLLQQTIPGFSPMKAQASPRPQSEPEKVILPDMGLVPSQA
ncbi:MAG: polysaccharide biosynthesis protein [Candidatus Promineifilaceae bacterium]